MTTPPRLTDPAALRRNRGRARAGALFLHEAARDELQDRLALVNRVFTDVAIVAPFPELWRDAWPQARVIADTEVLDLAAQSHDLVLHALALHWANDPLGQIIQCTRALRPDGAFFGVCFGGQTLHELRAALAQAESDVTGGLSPRVAPMGEIRDLGALLQRAGLALPVADSLPLTVSYQSPWHLMCELRLMGEGNALEGRLRHPTRRAVLIRAAEIYATRYAGPDGRVQTSFDLVFLHGWAPDASQPKPLRPGSAQTRLAEVLGTQETPLKD